MSDWVQDTPYVGRYYCPGCEPDADPISEILEMRRCERHNASMDGIDDAAVIAQGYLSGSGEVGDGNDKWCAFFHRGQVNG